MENNKIERHILRDRVIQATEGMAPKEYMEFMELSGPERLKRVEEILKKRENRSERYSLFDIIGEE